MIGKTKDNRIRNEDSSVYLMIILMVISSPLLHEKISLTVSLLPMNVSRNIEETRRKAEWLNWI